MKNVRDFDLNNKVVLLRCDFNVSIKDGKILDDTRIVNSLETIKYILNNNAKLVVLSHLGKVKTDDEKKDKSLRIVYLRLKELLGDVVSFVPFTRGKEVEMSISNMENGSMLLIENTRFEDIDMMKESKCDMELSKYWASLGDIFINDAFGTLHRKHASNYGISLFLDSGIGFLVEKELRELDRLDNPSRPYVVIMGGSKVSDKIKVIDALIKKVDYLLIGGAMANTFVKAYGYDIGSSMYEKDSISYCENLLNDYKDKIILPVDSYGSNDLDLPKVLEECGSYSKSFKAFDIGKKTIDLFCDKLKGASCVFWNGPLGVYENENYYYGTKKIMEYICNNDCYSILGGGDIVTCCKLFGLDKKISYISTGGGASLEYLVDKNLPGLVNIGE